MVLEAGGPVDAAEVEEEDMVGAFEERKFLWFCSLQSCGADFPRGSVCLFV